MAFTLTDVEINKKLAKPLDPKKGVDKRKLECIKIIARRFDDKYKIKVLDHVKWITKVGFKYEQGFHYKPLDNEKWRKTLKATKKFVPDKKNNIVGCLASVVTVGQGIRELGKDKSLHCAVDDFECSIHLDNTGFRLKGPFGTYYSLDGVQHIIYDLLWDDKVVRPAYNWWFGAGWTLDKVRPVFLNSKNKFSRYGVGVDFYESPNLKISADYTRHFDIGKNLNRNFYKGITKTKEQRFMINITGRHNIGN